MRRATVIGIGAAGALLWSAPAGARPTAPQAFCEVYSNIPACVGTVDCSACHETIEDPVTWNPYGEDLRAAFPTVGDDLSDAEFLIALPAALAEIETRDSDQDGFDNYDELLGGAWPGDAGSTPSNLECPAEIEELDYAICVYDPAWVFRKVRLDFCGASPTYDELTSFRALGVDSQMAAIHEELDGCLDSEFWLGKDGVLWQMAHHKVRPVGALNGSDEETGFLPLANYYDDYALYVYSQIDDHDSRSVITADFFVKRASNAPTIYEVTYDNAPSGCDIACVQKMEQARRAGVITSQWSMLYNTMFTAMPRTVAAQAYRAFLGLDIAKLEGLYPITVANGFPMDEPANYDGTGVDAAECATCHSTLDPLTYPFRNYNGLTGGKRGEYVDERMKKFFEDDYPGIMNTPEQGYIMGEPVDDLSAWADVAANSDAFAINTTRDYWKLLMGRDVDTAGGESDEFVSLWTALMVEHNYSVEAMLHDFVETEAYGAP